MAAASSLSLSLSGIPPSPLPLRRNPNPSLSAIPPRRATSTAISSAIAGGRRTLKSRLAAGETLYGMFLLSASPTMAEIAGLAGYDYIVVDMEHGPGGIAEALACLRAIAATPAAAVLRLPEISPNWAKKALDLGPQALIFPMVDSPAAAAAAVSFCRYPPRGVRGAAFPVVRASRYGLDSHYLRRCDDDDEVLIMCQVETETAAAAAAAIAAVDGVDCVQTGPLDLSAALGLLHDPGHETVRAAMAAIERHVLGSGAAYLGGFAMDYDPPAAMKRRGYNMVAGAVDLGMFRQAAVDDVARFRRE